MQVLGVPDPSFIGQALQLELQLGQGPLVDQLTQLFPPQQLGKDGTIER